MINNRVIKLGYSLLQNAGDAFNKPLVEMLSGMPVEHARVADAELLALGGGLANLQLSADFKRRALQRIAGVVYSQRPLYVWGSGFLHGNSNAPFYRKNLIFCALRGELSRRKVSGLLGAEVNVPLCDPGLLISDIYANFGEKKYSMGIISHYIESDHPYFNQLQKSCSDSIIIDIRKSPEQVFELISQCESIASSSLHGLIFADAMGIPSLRLKVTGKLAGGDFKFDDYYSSYGIDSNTWVAENRKSFPTVENIKDQYAISMDKVDIMKKELRNVFPKDLCNRE